MNEQMFYLSKEDADKLKQVWEHFCEMKEFKKTEEEKPTPQNDVNWLFGVIDAMFSNCDSDIGLATHAEARAALRRLKEALCK